MYNFNSTFVEDSIVNFIKFLSSYNPDFTTKGDFNREDGAVNRNTVEGLHLSSVIVSPEYAKKWNTSEKDFVVLVKDEVLLRNTLYRLGGIGKRPDNEQTNRVLNYRRSRLYTGKRASP